MSAITKNDPQPVVASYHLTLKLSDIKATKIKRVAVDESELAKLKGKPVVLNNGKEPLSSVYLGLFQEDVNVISIDPETKYDTIIHWT